MTVRRGVTLVLGVFAALMLYDLLGNPWLDNLVSTLALGWLKYPRRVASQLNPDPWLVATAVACLAGVTAGSHFFFCWAAGAEWPWKRSLKCVALVLLMFVAGIAMVGVTHQTAWLANSPEPLYPSKREPGARMVSMNNLKQIGIASHYHHDNTNPSTLPRSSFSAAGQPMHSWQTALLPYLEQGALHKQIDQTKPWTHSANAEPLGATVSTFLHPLAEDRKVNGFGASHYAGNPMVVMGEAQKLDGFPQGATNTILAGEVNVGFRAWGDPMNVRDPRQGVGGGPQAFGAPAKRPLLFVMLDGSVRTFDAKELAELMGKPPE